MQNKKNTFLIITISVILEITAIYFYILPKIDDYKTKQESLTTGKDNLTQLEKKLADFKKITDKKQNIGQAADKISGLLPTEPLTGDFMLELDSLAKSSNLTIPTITISEVKTAVPAKPTTDEQDSETKSKTTTDKATTTAKPSSTTGLNTLSFQTSVSGSYWDFMNFLAKLETSKRLNLIPSLSLAPGAEKVTVGLTGNFYYLDSKAATESTDSINLDNLDVITKLTNTSAIKKPSEQGLDGRDNPFAAL